MSICGAVDLANSMESDGMLHQAVQAFGSLGCSGSQPGNCERDLRRWLQCLFEFTLRPYTIWMELQETQLS